jgi:hypothetical protein
MPLDPFNLSIQRVAIIATAAAIVACSVIAPVNLHGQAKTGTPLGSVVSPAHSPTPSDQDVAQAVKEIAAIGSCGSFIWTWSNGDPEYQLLQTLTTLFREVGLKVFLQIAPTGIGSPAPPNGLPKTFTDPLTQAQYLNDAARLAALHPDYLNLGAEINLMYYLEPAEFNAFIPLYQQAYAIVKQTSPQTQVGVSYHLDLFFGYNEFNVPALLGPQDFIGFTTYPAWTVYKGVYPAPDQIALAYYDRLRIVFPTQPIVFAEVGWPSGGLSNLSDQNKYMAALPQYMAKTQPALVIWVMEHDVDNFHVSELSQAQINILLGFNVDPTELFNELNSMGMLVWDGPPKPAWVTASGLVFAAPLSVP